MHNDTAMAQCFTLANIVPQDSHNNQRQWRGIESDTRKYAARASGKVFVITGPVFGLGHKTIGPGKV
jgi:endonuclease G